MPFTTDPTSNIGRVRILITDRDPLNPIFDDTEIEAFLALESDSVYRASATGLLAIAADQALLLKVVKLLDSSYDGAKLADSLRQLAQKYLDRADQVDAASGGTFDWATFIDDPFAAREAIAKAAEFVV